MAQHQGVDLHVQGAQQRHHDALACITFAAKARAAVVHQRVPGGAYQHSIALANVSYQQFKLPWRRPGRLPKNHRHQQRQTQ